jgi:hypothetical protein
MNTKPTKLIATAIALTLTAAGALRSQITKVVPPEYANHEANSRYAFPFAKTDTQMQILTEGKLISNGPGELSSFAFRHDKPLTATAGYKKNYRVTLYPTTVTPAAMITDPNTNIGSAQGTVVFQALLDVPSVAMQLTAPASSFALRVPTTPPYPFDGTSANLLIHLETMDSNPVTSWYPDAVSRGNPAIRSESSVVGLGCSYSPTSGGPYAMTLSVGSATYLGGTLVVTPKRSPSTTPIGTWKHAILGLDASISRPGFPVDLTFLAMPGCRLFIDPMVTWGLPELASGDYTPLTLNIPNIPALTGNAFFLQALGAGNGPGLTGSVVTDTTQVMLAPNPPAASIVEAIYYSGTSWFGAFPTLDLFPVIQYDGVLR